MPGPPGGPTSRERRLHRSGQDLSIPAADGIHRGKLNPWMVEKLEKLNQARSRLYRSQILQVNTHSAMFFAVY